ncbi:MAG: DNA polymerase III subunit gamma/tau [Verrucomicrobiota bacterium]
MSALSSLPPELLESRPAAVLRQSLDRGRLPHAILLQGPSLQSLEAIALAFAGELLKSEQPLKHPDLFSIRPANKMRQINAEHTRAMIRDIQHSSHQGGNKVALIYEADCLNNAAANAFLKTLEEPPADTTIFLLSTRPYDLLATIRSRCVSLRLPLELDRVGAADWQQWLADYTEWLQLVASGHAARGGASECVIAIYGLTTRFSGILAALAAESWKSYKESLPDGLTDEQVTALESGYSKGLRARLLAEIEHQTRQFALRNPDDVPSAKLSRAISALEHVCGLLALNFNESAAMEIFLLRSLRNWAR